MGDDWGLMPGEQQPDSDGPIDLCDECGHELDSGSEYVDSDVLENESDGVRLFFPKWLCGDCVGRQVIEEATRGQERCGSA